MSNFNFKLDLTNCNANINAGIYETNNIYNIKVTANNNYDFVDNTPYLIIISNIGDYIEQKLTQIDNYSCSIDYYVNDNITDIKLCANATLSNKIKNKYGLISVYAPTATELKNISQHRFISFNNGFDYVDTAKYVVSLIRLYCNVNTTNKSDVYFGKYNTGVKSDIVTDDIITLDCGNVFISEQYNNALDYTDTDIDIYLPFIGFISLDTIKFMNKNINLKYIVNVINGDTLAILTADDNILLSESCNISFKIPYIMDNNNYINNSIEINANYLNDATPFIYIRRPIIISEPLYNNLNIYDTLNKYSGYTVVNNLNFNVIHTNITNTEIEEIKNILSDGVIL